MSNPSGTVAKAYAKQFRKACCVYQKVRSIRLERDVSDYYNLIVIICPLGNWGEVYIDNDKNSI